MIRPFEGHTPQLGVGSFVAAGATVIGRTTMGAGASVWFGSVVRGDVGTITIGPRTNIQDLCVVHVTTDRFDTLIGHDVTVGHRAVLHGCTVDHHVLIGMGAVVMDGAHVGAYSIVGAGALVVPGTKIPEGSLVLGAPARVVRTVTEAERRQNEESAAHYVELAARYLASP